MYDVLNKMYILYLHTSKFKNNLIRNNRFYYDRIYYSQWDKLFILIILYIYIHNYTWKIIAPILCVHKIANIDTVS